MSDSIFHRALPTSYAQGSSTDVGKEGNMQGGKFSMSCLRWELILANPLLGFSRRGGKQVSKTFLKAVLI